MVRKPAVPSLIVIPGSTKDDYRAIFAIAMAYAQSGLILSDRAHRSHETEFVFPAVVCSSFSIELFLKAFITYENTEKQQNLKEKASGHTLPALWQKISLPRRKMIVGMFRNPDQYPHENVIETHLKLFAEALDEVGAQPFVKWRYAYEIGGPELMSHAALVELTNALSGAAAYLFRPLSTSDADDRAIDSSAGERIELPNLRASSALILGRESPLRCIPSNIDSKQMRCLNAIRHAAETMDIAFLRLREGLTANALNPPKELELASFISHVFSDAWLFVRAVARIAHEFEKLTNGDPRILPNVESLAESTKPFRDLAELEHLGWGSLSWLTGVSLLPTPSALHCAIYPGSLSEPPQISTAPIVTTLDWPTDRIRLACGEVEADLSTVRKHVAFRLSLLEGLLEKAFDGSDTSR
ncbi:hypothetical protein, partial [Massilia pseudoviolaceinigra]|uniref:hypothetical protein n=1 Tax=Massilia pseudoviolaceinigra TaxID=3057165 RepID=UPI0027967829